MNSAVSVPDAGSYALLGPPGTGKSDMAASIADIVGADATLVLATKPREARSHGYVTRKIATELFFDAGWRPSLGRFEAGGYIQLLKRLEQLYADDAVRAVVIDVGTDAFELAAHELLSSEKAATPKDCRDPQSFYGAFRYKCKELVQSSLILAYAPTPKHVVWTMHTQPAKDESRGANETPDKKAKGIEYEGGVLPMVEGGYRRAFAGEFDAVLYTDILHEFNRETRRQEPRYVVQIGPDNERHAKIAFARDIAEKTLPNNFAALFEAAKGGAK